MHRIVSRPFEILSTTDTNLARLTIVGRFCETPRRLAQTTFVLRHSHHCPSGVVTSVPVGGLNSNVDGGIAARV
jgi:hypothetical protein